MIYYKSMEKFGTSNVKWKKIYSNYLNLVAHIIKESFNYAILVSRFWNNSDFAWINNVIFVWGIRKSAILAFINNLKFLNLNRLIRVFLSNAKYLLTKQYSPLLRILIKSQFNQNKLNWSRPNFRNKFKNYLKHLLTKLRLPWG